MTRASIGVSDPLDAYLQTVNPVEPAALKRCREETAKRSDSNMQIGPEQGALMAFLAKLIGARTYVEIGTFTGYSALVMALAMKERHGGSARVICLDKSDEYLGLAGDYWREAGAMDVIETRHGDALNSLKALTAEGLGDSVDIVFIDADKANYEAYYEEAASLLRPGGLMMLDNVLWSGDVADKTKTDEITGIMRRINGRAASDNRFDRALTAIGDGLLLLRKQDLVDSHIEGPDAETGRYPPQPEP